MQQVSYMGKGSILAELLNGALVRLGNCSKLTFSIEEEKKELQDYENAGGGLLDSVSRIKSVGISLECSNFSKENLALALRGTAATIAGTPIDDEAHTAKIGGYVVFSHIPNPAVAPVVTDATGAIIYDDDDYAVTRSGIEILAGSTIVDGATILISYTPLAQVDIAALTSAGDAIRLVFDGLNEARSGKPVQVEAYRVKFSPAKTMDWIADEFGKLPLEADVLKDESRSGAGVSQYFSVKMAS